MFYLYFFQKKPLLAFWAASTWTGVQHPLPLLWDTAYERPNLCSPCGKILQRKRQAFQALCVWKSLYPPWITLWPRMEFQSEITALNEAITLLAASLIQCIGKPQTTRSLISAPAPLSLCVNLQASPSSPAHWQFSLLLWVYLTPPIWLNIRGALLTGKPISCSSGNFFLIISHLRFPLFSLSATTMEMGTLADPLISLPILLYYAFLRRLPLREESFTVSIDIPFCIQVPCGSLMVQEHSNNNPKRNGYERLVFKHNSRWGHAGCDPDAIELHAHPHSHQTTQAASSPASCLRPPVWALVTIALKLQTAAGISAGVGRASSTLTSGQMWPREETQLPVSDSSLYRAGSSPQGHRPLGRGSRINAFTFIF